MTLFGRTPEPAHYFAVTVVDQSGRVIDRANLSALPPVGYQWGDRLIVGGSVDRAQMSDARTSVNLAKATVVVA